MNAPCWQILMSILNTLCKITNANMSLPIPDSSQIFLAALSLSQFWLLVPFPTTHVSVLSFPFLIAPLCLCE